MGETLLRMKPRRSRQGYTDYRKRLKRVKSRVERLVIRRSSRTITVQVVQSRAGGDNTIVTVSSNVLRKYGWRASLKSIPAAYLTGLIAGKKALAKGVSNAIVDIGVYRSVKGSRFYAAAKGAVDAGMEIKVGEGVFPSEERILGKHITDYVQKIESSPKGYQFIASDKQYLLKLAEEVERIKKQILGGGGDE